MKRIDNSEMDKYLDDLPDNLVELVKGSLDTKNFSKIHGSSIINSYYWDHHDNSRCK